MATTTKSLMFVPEIATEVASAVFPDELALRFAGSPFVRPFPPEAVLGEEGETVKFPRYAAMSGFAAMTEDNALVPQALSTALDTSVVQVAGMAVEITDFADLASRGDPSAEVGRQTARLAAEYIDSALITEAETSALSIAIGGTWNYDAFIAGLFEKWGDKAYSLMGGVVVHSKVMGDIMVSPEFKDKEKAGDMASNVNGLVGRVAGIPVFMSDRLSSTGSPTAYTCLAMKRGALGLKFQRDLLVESDRDILKKNTVIAADVRFSVHLFYDNPSPAVKIVLN